MAAGMSTVSQTNDSVLCRKCGIVMQPNAVNMCVNCLSSEIDITEGLPKCATIIFCPECDSYLQQPSTWIKAQLESRELLIFCLSKLRKFNDIRLVDAQFIWTEPLSRIIKVRLVVRKGVLNGEVVLEQAHTVEYVQKDCICESCIGANPDHWVAAVQLRQQVPHRHTFFYLLQCIIKHEEARHVVRIKQMDQGIDFFFVSCFHALRFVEYLGELAIIRRQRDKHLGLNGNYYKHTITVEICSICPEDLVCLPPEVAASLGNIGPLVICTKVNNKITLLDPFTLRRFFLDAMKYWKAPFMARLSSRQLVEFVVLDLEVLSCVVSIGGSEYALANAQVARVADIGNNDITFNVRTHLGHLLNPGDHALGYDLYGTNTNHIDELDRYEGSPVLPDVILIKKKYEEKNQWRPGSKSNINMESYSCDEEKMMNIEYEQLLRDLVNDSMYRNTESQPSEMASMSTDGEDVPDFQ